MLLQGAQENLARQDLSLREECDLVARLINEFYPAGQEEIAKLIGKTRGWIAPRARVNGLPNDLHFWLWQRPVAMTHILELAALYHSQPAAAVELAERIVKEELTLSAVRVLLNQSTSATLPRGRDEKRNLTGTDQIVSNGTNDAVEELSGRTTVREHERTMRGRVSREDMQAHHNQGCVIETDEVPDLDSGQVEIIDALQTPANPVRIDETYNGASPTREPLNEQDRERLRVIMELLLRASEESVRPPRAIQFDDARIAIDQALEVVRSVLYGPSSSDHSASKPHLYGLLAE
jgi:hypothetical protein